MIPHKLRLLNCYWLPRTSRRCPWGVRGVVYWPVFPERYLDARPSQAGRLALTLNLVALLSYFVLAFSFDPLIPLVRILRMYQYDSAAFN